MTSYTIEMEMKVFEDESGNYWVVKDDVDGLGLVTFASHCDDQTVSFTMPYKAAIQFYKALREYLEFKVKTV